MVHPNKFWTTEHHKCWEDAWEGHRKYGGNDSSYLEIVAAFADFYENGIVEKSPSQILRAVFNARRRARQPEPIGEYYAAITE